MMQTTQVSHMDYISLALNISDEHDEVFSNKIDLSSAFTLEKITYSLMHVQSISHGFNFPALLNLPNANNNHQAIFIWLYTSIKAHDWQQLADDNPDQFFAYVVKEFEHYVANRTCIKPE